MFDACNTAVSADLPFPGTELFLDGSVEGIVHKGRFSRTGDAGYTDHFTQREFYIDALQVMFAGTLNTDHMPVPFPPFLRNGDLQAPAQIFSSQALGFQKAVVGAAIDHFTSVGACEGPDINDVVGGLHHLRVVLHNQNGVSDIPQMMQAADNIIDIGPFADSYGGEVVYSGPYNGLLKSKSLTGKYLSGRLEIPIPQKRRKGNGHVIRVAGASEHNLKSIDVDFPLGKMVCVTGVSGSGKSTLVHDTLYASIQKQFGTWKGKIGRNRGITGIKHIEAVEMVDQSPIGRSTRSNPATY